MVILHFCIYELSIFSFILGFLEAVRCWHVEDSIIYVKSSFVFTTKLLQTKFHSQCWNNLAFASFSVIHTAHSFWRNRSFKWFCQFTEVKKFIILHFCHNKWFLDYSSPLSPDKSTAQRKLLYNTWIEKLTTGENQITRETIMKNTCEIKYIQKQLAVTIVECNIKGQSLYNNWTTIMSKIRMW